MFGSTAIFLLTFLSFSKKNGLFVLEINPLGVLGVLLSAM